MWVLNIVVDSSGLVWKAMSLGRRILPHAAKDTFRVYVTVCKSAMVASNEFQTKYGNLPSEEVKQITM